MRKRAVCKWTHTATNLLNVYLESSAHWGTRPDCKKSKVLALTWASPKSLQCFDLFENSSGGALENESPEACGITENFVERCRYEVRRVFGRVSRQPNWGVCRRCRHVKEYEPPTSVRQTEPSYKQSNQRQGLLQSDSSGER